MIIKKIQTMFKNNKDIDEIRKENFDLKHKLAEIKDEIYWLHVALDSNRYGNLNNTLSIASRKIKDIEDIIERK